jgi:hypothetical protein
MPGLDSFLKSRNLKNLKLFLSVVLNFFTQDLKPKFDMILHQLAKHFRDRIFVFINRKCIYRNRQVADFLVDLIRVIDFAFLEDFLIIPTGLTVA